MQTNINSHTTKAPCTAVLRGQQNFVRVIIECVNIVQYELAIKQIVEHSNRNTYSKNLLYAIYCNIHLTRECVDIQLERQTNKSSQPQHSQTNLQTIYQHCLRHLCHIHTLDTLPKNSLIIFL